MTYPDLYFALKRWKNLAKNAVAPCAITVELRRSVQYIERNCVMGDVAEFGCWSGCSASTLYSALRKTSRRLYLFDSFDGLPEPTQEDSCFYVLTGGWKRGTFKGQSAGATRRAFPRAIVYEGWYSKTVPTLGPLTRFGLLHIDCDLYSSTMDALTPLFARGQVSKGALLLFDDWHHNQADNNSGERKAWKELCQKFNIEFEDDGTYSWGKKRIIVHSYRAATGKEKA
jgi:hypothetical protein